MRNVLLFVVLFIGLSACQRAEKEASTSLKFSLDGVVANSTSSLSEMNCFGVFVSSETDSDLQKNKCSYANESTFKASGFTYGKFYGPFYRPKGIEGADISISVPNGDNRVLRLVGVNVDASGSVDGDALQALACSSLNRKYIDSFYNIAESKPLQLTGDDLSVDLTAVFDTSKEIPVATCTNLNSSEVSGVPSRVAVIIQDNLNSNSVNSANNCVGVKFQLQDAYGKPATSSSAISASIIESFGSTSIGNFYNRVASSSIDLCALSNQVAVVDQKIEISFSAGTSDKHYFFRPNAAIYLAANGIVPIAVKSDGLSGGYAEAKFTLGSRTPTKYAFYDLFSNASTVTSTSSNPAILKKGECRFGSLQFLDQYSVPQQLTTGAMTPDTIRIATDPAGSIEFYPSPTACSVMSGATGHLDFLFTSNFATTGHGFFYRVSNTAPSNISFTVRNMLNTISPVISNGEVQSNSNLWQIADP